MHLSAAISGGDNPGEIRGHGAGFVNFGSIILSPGRRDMIRLLLHFRSSNLKKRLIRATFWLSLLLQATSTTETMAFISIQNTLSTFLTFWHLCQVQGVKFPSQVSRRQIYDVNLVLASLRRKIQQRLFYGLKEPPRWRRSAGEGVTSLAEGYTGGWEKKI